MSRQKVFSLPSTEMAPQRAYTNDFSSEMIHKFMMSTTPNVQFIFENDGETVKIPAHKGLLSVSSPVFDAMFNGELKEKGDVRIVDATPAAFQEFLQFFYDKKVKLTMSNVADVLNLVHKYDIAAGSKIVEDYLVEHLTGDRILWGLHLAMKYQLKRLEGHCKRSMENDPVKVLDVLKFKAKGSQALSTKNDSLSDTELAAILPNVLMMTKEIINDLKGSSFPFPLFDLDQSDLLPQSTQTPSTYILFKK